MILFFGNKDDKVFAVQVAKTLPQEDLQKLSWLFGNRAQIEVTTSHLKPKKDSCHLVCCTLMHSQKQTKCFSTLSSSPPGSIPSYHSSFRLLSVAFPLTKKLAQWVIPLESK